MTMKKLWELMKFFRQSQVEFENSIFENSNLVKVRDGTWGDDRSETQYLIQRLLTVNSRWNSRQPTTSITTTTSSMSFTLERKSARWNVSEFHAACFDSHAGSSCHFRSRFVPWRQPVPTDQLAESGRSYAELRNHSFEVGWRVGKRAVGGPQRLDHPNIRLR